jgi:hypothetical protein
VELLHALQDHFGGAVVQAETCPEGFSPAVAAVVRFANGTSAFVKAVNKNANPDSPQAYRNEADLTPRLPPGACAPALLWSYEDADWVALAFEKIVGHPPELPWRQADLDRVLLALHALATALTPSPVDAPAVATVYGFDGWREVATLGDEAVRLVASVEPWAARNIERLAALEPSWEKAAQGSTLVHGDIRADNVLLAPDRVVFVDWAGGGLGAPWLDLMFFLPSVAMQGGPPPEEVFTTHPLGALAPADAATAVLCAIAGFFLWRSRQIPPPGLPTLRQFQLGQGRAAAAWLRERTGWT